MGTGASSSVPEGVTANPRLIYTDNLSKHDRKVSRKKLVYLFFERDRFGVNTIILWNIDRSTNFVFFYLKEINFYYCLLWNSFYGKTNPPHNYIKIITCKIKAVYSCMHCNYMSLFFLINKLMINWKFTKIKNKDLFIILT